MEPLTLTCDSTLANARWTARESADCYGISVRSAYDAKASGRLAVLRFGLGRGGICVSEVLR